ncbi:MAG: tetratricopeptide repeat protein [Planctomycetaceae bacterium]|jgi:predicted Zn-dependent protease|nr:tetratricopeptide repeat protein [Planctomycetaceae bacterium]
MTPSEQYDVCIGLLRANQTSEAVASLKEITEKFPDFPLAYNCLAAIYKKENNIEAAIAAMEKYCAAEPDDPFGFSVLSAYCIEAGRREQAEEARGTAFELRFRSQMSHSENPPENQ